MEVHFVSNALAYCLLKRGKKRDSDRPSLRKNTNNMQFKTVLSLEPIQVELHYNSMEETKGKEVLTRSVAELSSGPTGLLERSPVGLLAQQPSLVYSRNPLRTFEVCGTLTTGTGGYRKGDASPLPLPTDRPLSAEGKPLMRKEMKERLKDPDDGIILSPQRRSFLSGCQAPPQSSSSSSMSQHQHHQHHQHHHHLHQEDSRNRRSIHDLDDIDELNSKRWNRNPHPQHGSSSSSNAHHSQHHSHHAHHSHHSHHHNNNNKRYSRSSDYHMRRHRMPETEPEWMSASISHGDVMELRGFDDDMPDEDKKAPSTNNELIRVLRQIQATHLILWIFWICLRYLTFRPHFYLVQFQNGSETKKESRFSKFFQNRNKDISPQPNQTLSVQQQPPLQPTPQQLPITQQTMIRIPSPGDSNNYFAPISPAAPTNSEQAPRRTTATSGAPSLSNSLMEMLRIGARNENGKQRENEESKTPHNNSIWNQESSNAQQASSFPFHQSQPNAPTEEKSNSDLTAFNKFAALVQGSSTENNLPQQPPRHPQPLPSQLQGSGFGLVRPSPIPANAPTENDILLGNNNRYSAQVPQRSRAPPQFQRAAPSMNTPELHQPQNTPPSYIYEVLQFIQQAPFNPEILKRSEVLALQSGLARGDVSHSMLIQQFAFGSLTTPPPPPPAQIPPQQMMHLHSSQRGTPPHHRQSGDVITSFLKRSNGESLSSPTDLNACNTSSSQHVPHYLGHQGRKKNIDDHRESAKKTEEGSPLVFTPTVVIKRMAADRRDSDPKPMETLNKPDDGAIKRLFGQQSHQNINKEEGLSRFFTPDVLAQASSGNMPSMPPLPTKKALTLEELEKLQRV
ncbi:EIF4ENIF1 [Lepeophtheirus salmonis]|uniref:EIF4ENIF1 n=1 Tax=Lepeophtheirus salmonis TaxID=72036 RepID=A0A7R8H3N9_LEPSM|nr:EIF4ENIF1 [Lepeophtheirus salmonis]CAF2836431.1 EIF4ENIF1 [Lepeophtheirus salmonis]